MSVLTAVTEYINTTRASLDALLSSKDAIGLIGRAGTIRRGVFKGYIETLVAGTDKAKNSGDLVGLADLADNTNVYLHFRLPWRANQHVGMYHLKISGYSLDSGKSIDVTAVGYVYQPYNDVIAKELKSNLQGEVYIDANRNTVLTLLFPNIHATTVFIDAMKVDPTTYINPGDIVCQASKSNRVVFAPAP